MVLSVIIPFYRDRPWIEACLRSVLDQSWPEIECLAVDDCGGDGSADVVEALQREHPRGGCIRLLRHTRNRGQAAARNTALAEATGTWIFCLDADDRLEPEALASLMQAATAAEGQPVDWVQGNFRRVSPNLTARITSYYRPDRPLYRRAKIESHFDELNFSNVANKLIRREFIVQNKLFFREGLLYEDLWWCLTAYPAVRLVATLPEITYCHNLREGSTTRSSVSLAKLDSLDWIVGTLRAESDPNLRRVAAEQAVFCLKSLLQSDLSRKDKRLFFNRLWLHAKQLPYRELRLSLLNHALSHSFGMPRFLGRVYSRGVMACYQLLER